MHDQAEHREPITPDMLVWAYTNGVFPMADSRRGVVRWYSADPRAILPLDKLHVSHSLRQRLRRAEYDIRFDTAFTDVMLGCARPRRDDGETWINDQIVQGYPRLHELGLAHSVEAWRKKRESGKAGERERVRRNEPRARRIDRDGFELVGGLYGVSLGGAFFGESMFSTATDASKVCLVRLVEHLRRRGYDLLDVQMNSAHMQQFGTIDIPRETYLKKLEAALLLPVTWEDE